MEQKTAHNVFPNDATINHVLVEWIVEIVCTLWKSIQWKKMCELNIQTANANFKDSKQICQFWGSRHTSNFETKFCNKKIFWSYDITIIFFQYFFYFVKWILISSLGYLNQFWNATPLFWQKILFYENIALS